MESGVTVIFPLLREGKRVDVECRVESGVWTCSDPSLLERLQKVRQPEGYRPWPDLALAERAARMFAGTVRGLAEAGQRKKPRKKPPGPETIY
jgi:hypothetical protein